MKNTKIVCTLGPASEEKDLIAQMTKAGMNAVRLNFSHGSYDHFKKIIYNVQSISKDLNQPIAIIQDLQGPKIRTGLLPKEGLAVKRNQKITLTIRNISADHQTIPVQYKNLANDLKRNDRILIDDGLIELQVITRLKTTSGKDYTDIVCRVLNQGVILSHKGINVPHGQISAPALSSKDKQDLAFGLKHKVDYVALSFVKTAQDIIELKNLIKKYRSNARVMAKIERQEALENLEEIIHASDAIMVARGDLGLEIPAEQLPLVQKKIVRECLNHGKPVLIATQLLSSMVKNPRATRAEISDTATAVLEYADGLVLSNETSIGKYPVLAVQTLNKVATTIEKELKEREIILKSGLGHESQHPLLNATSRSACKIAQNLNAKYMVIMTNKGYSALQISKHRAFLPIITITDREDTKRMLSLVWGIQDIHVLKSLNEEKIIKFLKQNYKVESRDEILIYNSSDTQNLIYTVIV